MRYLAEFLAQHGVARAFAEEQVTPRLAAFVEMLGVRDVHIS